MSVVSSSVSPSERTTTRSDESCSSTTQSLGGGHYNTGVNDQWNRSTVGHIRCRWNTRRR